MAQSAETLRTRTFVDLNAISPSTSEKNSKAFDGVAGLEYVDGGIIDGPAKVGSSLYSPLLVLSGPGAQRVREVLSPLFLSRTKVVGAKIGQASALKLSYASLTKGVTALAYNSALLSSSWDVADALEEELGTSQPALLKVLKGIPGSSAKAFRWIREPHRRLSLFEEIH